MRMLRECRAMLLVRDFQDCSKLFVSHILPRLHLLASAVLLLLYDHSKA